MITLHENKKTQNIGDRGFVILFAMLISTIMLLITSGIFNVVQKQVVLSSYSRESQRAFYAADAALECALYYDISPTIVQTSFPIDGTTLATMSCAGEDFEIESLGSTDQYDHSFAFRYFNNSDDSMGCAYVFVEKSEAGGVFDIRATAAGFNSCIPDTVSGYDFKRPNFDDPTLLERRVTIEYQSL